MGVGEHSGGQWRHRQQPAEVVVEVADQALDRVGDAVDQYRQQRGDGDGAQEGDGRGRQRRPAEAQQSLEIGAEQALEHAFEEQQVRDVEEQCHQETEVERVAHHLAEGGAPEELLAGPGAQGDQPQSLPGGGVSRRRKVDLGSQEEDPDQPPQQAEDEDGHRPLQGGPTGKVEQGHDCFASTSFCRLRPIAAAAAPSTAPAPAAAAMVLPDPQSPADSGW